MRMRVRRGTVADPSGLSRMLISASRTRPPVDARYCILVGIVGQLPAATGRARRAGADRYCRCLRYRPDWLLFPRWQRKWDGGYLVTDRYHNAAVPIRSVFWPAIRTSDGRPAQFELRWYLLTRWGPARRPAAAYHRRAFSKDEILAGVVSAAADSRPAAAPYGLLLLRMYFSFHG